MILSTAEFLLPRKGTEMSKWAVIACDQFTSDRAYWDKLDAYVGDAPSTLRLILPEVYLGDGDGEKRAADIYAAMERYCADGTLEMRRWSATARTARSRARGALSSSTANRTTEGTVSELLRSSISKSMNTPRATTRA